MEAKEIADMNVLKRERTFDFLGIEKKARETRDKQQEMARES